MQRPPQTPVLRRSAEKGSLPRSPAPGERFPATTYTRQSKTPKPTPCFVYRGPPLANGGHLEPATCQSSSPFAPGRAGSSAPAAAARPLPAPAGVRGSPSAGEPNAAGAAPAAGSPHTGRFGLRCRARPRPPDPRLPPGGPGYGPNPGGTRYRLHAAPAPPEGVIPGQRQLRPPPRPCPPLTPHGRRPRRASRPFAPGTCSPRAGAAPRSHT